MNDLLDAALELHAAGLAVVPISPDGTKRPAVAWKHYQTARPAEQQLQAWFGGRTAYEGLGVLTGATSGGVIMLEAEGRAVADGLVEKAAALMTNSGLGELWARLAGGWMELTPSGGLHWHLRLVDGEALPGNTKLARRPGEVEGTVEVLFETRGEGGFTVVAPSSGRSHPSGKPWLRVAGGPSTIPTFTRAEYDAVCLALSTFDTMPAATAAPAAERQQYVSAAGRTAGSGPRPGDDFNERTSWDDLLIPRGWTKGGTIAGAQAWTRPGKSARDGISATTGFASDGVDRLYVFTTSTEFEAEQPYTKFAAYALLEHGGDYATAAKALREEGFGAPRENIVNLTIDGPMAPRLTVIQGSSEVDGTAALAPHPMPERSTLHSEDHYSLLLAREHGDRIRFVPERSLWSLWNGKRWVLQPKGGGAVRQLAKDVIRAVLVSNPDTPALARRALSNRSIDGTLLMASTIPALVAHSASFDANPWELNTDTGLVDLRTGQLRPHDPAALCQRITPAGIAAAPSPRWLEFLAVTIPDPEIRAYVARLCGLALIGKVLEQQLVFLHGLGANGKSTMMETIMKALGTGATGYASAISSELLMASAHGHEARPDSLAALQGVRLAVASELDDGQRFAEARIKKLTGADSIEARHLYGTPFTFEPSHSIWLLGNHRPTARVGGMAFWRRIKLVAFMHTVAASDRDPNLATKLAAEDAGVLRWMLDGLADYMVHGMREPAAVRAATEGFEHDQDTVGRFVGEMCHRASSEDVRVEAPKLRDAYERWCRSTGDEPVSPKRFTQELADRFDVGSWRSHGRRFCTRIALIGTEESDTDPTLEWYR